MFSPRHILKNRIMQRRITSFFGGGGGTNPPPTKRAKTTSTATKSTSVATTSSSPSSTASSSTDAFLPFDVEEGWKNALSAEVKKSYFLNLQTFLSKEYKSKKVFPPKNEVFEAFRLDLDKVKVVIIGQDPYHGPGQAHGLAFSVRRGVRPPPSLKNIYKELHADLGTRIPSHGFLKSWSEQGVLLLNTVLTVRKGEAFSHRKKGWENFTAAALRVLDEKCDGLVFLCWGKAAQTRAECVDRKRHLVIHSSHPSPLGATKTEKPFIGSRCFSKANAYLKEKGKGPVDWRLPK